MAHGSASVMNRNGGREADVDGQTTGRVRKGCRQGKVKKRTVIGVKGREVWEDTYDSK